MKEGNLSVGGRKKGRKEERERDMGREREEGRGGGGEIER